LQFHADLQLYTLSIMLVGGTTLVGSSTLARRSLPARWLAATRMAVVCRLTAPRRLIALRSLSDSCRPMLLRGSILAGNPGLQLDSGLYLHAGSHAGLATPRSRQPHTGSLQPVAVPRRSAVPCWLTRGFNARPRCLTQVGGEDYRFLPCSERRLGGLTGVLHLL